MSDVFISYSHHDKVFLDHFKRHLRPLMKHIDFWDDSRILAGQKWKNEIANALSSCKVGILLLSADFFNSDFIQFEELPILLKAAEEKGATILSVVLKPCMFSEYKVISQYQAINSPSYTVIQMKEHEQEQLWIKLALRIKQILFP
jgi:hypothetical protein